MIAGIVIVNDPVETMNGALDYMGTFTINGGLLIAADSAGMAQAPSDNSTQNPMFYNFTSYLTARIISMLESKILQKYTNLVSSQQSQLLWFWCGRFTLLSQPNF